MGIQIGDHLVFYLEHGIDPTMFDSSILLTDGYTIDRIHNFDFDENTMYYVSRKSFTEQSNHVPLNFRTLHVIDKVEVTTHHTAWFLWVPL